MTWQYTGALLAFISCADQPLAPRAVPVTSSYRDPFRLIRVDIPGTTVSGMGLPGGGSPDDSAFATYTFKDGVGVQVTDAWRPAVRGSVLEAELPQRSDTALYEKECSFQFVTTDANVTCAPYRDVSHFTWWRHDDFWFSAGVRAAANVTNERAAEALETVVGTLMTKASTEFQ